jgi:thymidylate synthase
MNNLDKQYTDLLQDILDNGVAKQDRTGTGTISVFGRQIRHKMSEGFPLLTTKKMYWKGIVTELIWFLRGDTNIKFLVDSDCHIWDGDAYKNYDKLCIDTKWMELVKKELNGEVYDMGRKYNQEEFINKIKTDDEFAKKWGELGPIYGKQWREWSTLGKGQEMNGLFTIEENMKMNSIDQITNLINDLKTNPDSRRLMVNAWNVGELDQMTLPPCHYGFQVYTKELSYNEREQLALSYPHIKKLCDVNGPMTPKGWDDYNIPTRAISLMYNARSQDVPLGTPFNISSYGLLLTILAKEVNMIPDELIANMGDCHIYLNQIDGVKEQIGREPYPLPKLLCLDGYHYLMDKELVGEIPFTEKIEKFRPDFFTLENYQSHPSIKMPLSN